jgi:benzoyl-CoA reductase/2-hydroxyglutaryl-CoA dehydratase subunit BcrC/BadD/HgdB
MTKKKTRTGFKRLASARMMKQVMSDHFHELDEAAKTGCSPIAWCSSVGPAELLRALGFLVYFPENHGALLGATRRSGDCIPRANSQGYSPDICSYLTSDVGAYLGGDTPLSLMYRGIERVPKPDVLVYNTNQCRDIKDWFMWYSRELEVPCMGIETFRSVDGIDGEMVHAIAAQHRELVPALEKISGKKLDIDRLREVVGLSRRCSDLWNQVLETAKAKPSPFSFFDGLVHMGPAVVARGTNEAVDYYEVLLKELNQRIRDNVAAVEEEAHRIFWDGMPVWGKMRAQGNLFIKLKSCVVASNYCNAWVFEALDPADPFESMARAYTELFIVRSDRSKERIIEKFIRDYAVDGILFLDAKTCPNTSNNRYGMPARLAEKLGIPTVTISGDFCDLRLYSEEQSTTLIEAFVEQLEG